MKKNYPSNFIGLLMKPILILGFLFASFTGYAQTTCTSNDPTLCASALPDVNAIFTANTAVTTVTTTGGGSAPIFNLVPTLASTTSLSINSGQYLVTTDNCVIVSFTEARIGTTPTGPTSVAVVLANGTVISCPASVSVNATTGAVCVQICDPRIDVGQYIRFRLTFNVTTGNFNNESVVVSAFAVLNVAVNITCPATFICLDNTTGCTPCDPALFPILSGKIRVFFPTPIPIGTPTPAVTAAATVVGGVTTPLAQFKLCLTADAGTNVTRTFADYCVYSNIANQTLPTTNLVLTFQSGSFPALSCPLTLATVVCPTGFTNITDSRTCVNCDPNNFPFSAGKIRIFFPTPIQQDLINPLITAVAGAGITANSLKLCALADGGTNVARTYADYCVFSNIANFTLPLINPLTFTIQLSSCSQPQVCVVQPVTLPPCTATTFEVIADGNGGGTGGGLGTCASTTTCAGSTVFLASRLRVNLSTCLPAGVPAPTISSIQTVNADGSISLLNNDYCFVVSDESAALINTVRCFIEYCVYAKVNGNTFFVNPPATLQLNFETTATLGGQQTPLTNSCSVARRQGPTPVTLLNFNYQLKNCGVNLKWSTAQETNSKEFVVQNSTDGTTWTTIGTVTAKGTTNNRSDYSFVHPNPAKGQNFYRFVGIDLDGTSKYSNILTTAINCSKSTIDVYPNPFVNDVDIYFTATKNGLAKISIHDNAGRLMMQTKRAVLPGSNTINLNRLDRLPKGMYILTVQTDDAMLKQKLLK